MTFGSLFAGIGGLDLGLERAGMECEWQVEIDDYATKVLERHWPNVRRWRDVRTFPPDNYSDTIRKQSELQRQSQPNGRANRLPSESYDASELWRVDLICGGFPCQDISYAGRGSGLEGERSGLFFEALRVVRQLRPRYVLLENVAALLTRGLDRVLGELGQIGYDAEWHCIPAAAVGAPHIRDRVFVIGTNADSQGERCGPGGAGGASGFGAWEEDEAGLADSDVSPDIKRVARPILRSIPHSTEECRYREQWSFEPDVGRVANGVPARVDRLRCLGNAVVPQVAEWIGQKIIRSDVELP